MNCLTIALSGLEEADVERVRDALDRDALARWQLHDDATTDNAEADLLIVDVDSVWGHMDWLKATARGQRTASCSNQPPAQDGGLMLLKPLESDHLVRMLQALAEDGLSAGCETHAHPQTDAAMHESSAVQPSGMANAPSDNNLSLAAESSPADNRAHAPIGSAASSDATGMEAWDAAAVQPEAPAAIPATVAEWLLAGMSQAPFALRHDDHCLLIDSQRAIYQGREQLKPLIPLLKQSPDAMQTPDASELARLDAAGQPIDRLLWLAALIATPGQLCTRHDSDTRFRLDRWPQIEREFPRHFRIATAMMKQPGSLGELASAANTPQADVADFINAYTATGYVIASDADITHAAKARPRLRNLFARSANR